MANEIIRKLLIKNFSEFEFAFSHAKYIYVNKHGKIFHNLEYGEYRERILKKLLGSILPSYLSVGSGFIVNSNNEVSTQCDIIIYDNVTSPSIEGDLGQRFYPVESVVAVGEVKSTIHSTKQLNGYLDKMAKVAALKNNIDQTKPVALHDFNYEPNSLLNPKDGIFTFIVCSDFCFKLEHSKINETSEVPIPNKINCILSLKDGLICRKLNNGCNWHYPLASNQGFCELGFIPNDDKDFKKHYMIFTSILRLMSESAHRFKVDLSYYIFEKNEVSD